MAGVSWYFIVSPETINEVTVTGDTTTVVLQKTAEGKFYTPAFVETNYVTISATGYQDVENVLVSTSSITMIPVSSKPSNLYAYTDPNVSSETLYAWDVSDITSGTIPSTIYTKTETIDASTEYFNADGSQLDITTITYNKFTVSGFKWFSTDPVPTIAFDCG